jgi:GTP-binding protein EngB required for normal cell division
MIKNKEILKVIFDKIENKEKLKKYYQDIDYIFDEEMKCMFYSLFEDEKITEIKNKIADLFKELEYLKNN